MAIGINTNLGALNAQRQLNGSQGTLSTAMQRLSSGLRINSAKDDAAGLAITDRMTSQVKGLNQAVRNANDGISVAQTAEGALQESTNILQRMRELAVQSSNDSNSASDRKSIQDEVDQLTQELDRIAGTTSFNGTKLLDGTAKGKSFQIGANAGETMSISIASASSKDLNLNGYTGLGELNGGRVASAAIAAGDVAINGVDLGAVAASAGNFAKNVADAINAKTPDTGVTATAYNTVKGGVVADQPIKGITIAVNGAAAVTVSDAANLQDFAKRINQEVAGVTASLNGQGQLVLANTTGATITISENAAGDAAKAGLTAGTNQGYVSLKSADGSDIQIGKGSVTATATESDVQAMGFNVSNTANSVSGASVGTGGLTETMDIKINGVALKVDTGSDGSAAAKAAAINSISDKTGVKASASNVVDVSVDIANVGATFINGVSVDLSGALSLNSVVDTINGASLQGVVASAGSDGKLKLTSSSGLNIKVDDGAGAAAGGFGAVVNQTGKLTLTGDNGADVKVEGNAGNLAVLGLVNQGGSDEAIGSGLDVSTTENAAVAIKRIDEALKKIDDSRGQLGAFQNRLTSTISNLQNVSENIASARGRIQDADFAAETQTMSKAQVLQQAGMAMLAQANQSSQNVMSLLR